MNTSGNTWTNKADDEAVQAALLRQLLDLHPSNLTSAELTREIAGAKASFAERDAVDRALRDLEAVGLLHRGEDFVTPTRAALRISELLDR
jgi:DNA-binding HxlR family transcriptional regulator